MTTESTDIACGYNVGVELLRALGMSPDDHVERIVIVANANDLVKVYVTRCVSVGSMIEACRRVSKYKLVADDGEKID